MRDHSCKQNTAVPSVSASESSAWALGERAGATDGDRGRSVEKDLTCDRVHLLEDHIKQFRKIHQRRREMTMSKRTKMKRPTFGTNRENKPCRARCLARPLVKLRLDMRWQFSGIVGFGTHHAVQKCVKVP